MLMTPLKKNFGVTFVVIMLLLVSHSIPAASAPTAPTSTYDFKDNLNNKAFEGADAYQPPEELAVGAEVAADGYRRLSEPDGMLAYFSAPAGLSDYHRFEFKIFEPVDTISDIYVEHQGYADTGNPGLILFIWNYTASSWQYLSETNQAFSVGTSNVSIAKGIGDYFDGNGNLNLLAQAKQRIASCPFLYAYDGQRYVFVADLYNRGILAVPKFRPQPEDYAKIENDQLQPKDGLYRVQVTQEYDEISYLDNVSLAAVDHSAGVDVFTSLLRADTGKIFTVSRNLSPPISASDENGRDVLAQIVRRDGLYTYGRQNELDILDLDLGDLSSAGQISLVISAYTNWDNNKVPRSNEQENRIGRYVQVRDRNGNWTSVFKDFELIAPAGLPRTYLLDMTGKFVTDDYSVRIGYYPDVRFDYVGVDTTPHQNVMITALPLIHADLHFRGYSDLSGLPSMPNYYRLSPEAPEGYSHPAGNFTRFGDVSPLLIDRDNKFAILRHGDEVSVDFQYVPPEDGVERDFFLYSWGYYKGRDFATGGTVEPLPFHGMSSYPYPLNESYPFDDDHLRYLKEYNTRQYIDDKSAAEHGHHQTIYTDYVKVDISSIPVTETSTTLTTAVNSLPTLMPYVSVAVLIAVMSIGIAILKMRRSRAEKG